MKDSTQTCDQLRLEAFLQGDLNAAEEAELAAHLNQCVRCREQLEASAAEPNCWNKASELLKPQSLDHEESPAGKPERSLHIQHVLDALAPTDDPEMLGRLGGYEVSGVVGTGGMGVVLKAIDKSLDRSVAIKVLAPHLASSGAARKRFAREAKAAAAVLHPNVMAIHSVSHDQPLPYLVMPYHRGVSLQKRIEEEGSLPICDILRIGSQIADGLAAAHAQGLVHRDIKPANILLEDGVERVAITDFGLARAVDDATMTRTGVIAGTPQYMSPEQARGDSVDQRSDLFSLGSVLYTMCTGRPPFRAETSYGIMRRITDNEPQAIPEINPDTPEWLCLIIKKLMAKQPEHRLASAGLVAKLLQECLAHVQQPTTVPLPTIVAPQSVNRRFSRSRHQIGVIAMLAAFGFGFLGFVLWQSTEPPDISGRWTSDGWSQVVDEATIGLVRHGDSNSYSSYSKTRKRWSTYTFADHLSVKPSTLGEFMDDTKNDVVIAFDYTGGPITELVAVDCKGRFRKHELKSALDRDLRPILNGGGVLYYIADGTVYAFSGKTGTWDTYDAPGLPDVDWTDGVGRPPDFTKDGFDSETMDGIVIRRPAGTAVFLADKGLWQYTPTSTKTGGSPGTTK